MSIYPNDDRNIQRIICCWNNRASTPTYKSTLRYSFSIHFLLRHPTIQNILNKPGMGKRYELILKLEEKIPEHEIELTSEYVAWTKEAILFFQEHPLESNLVIKTVTKDKLLRNCLSSAD